MIVLLLSSIRDYTRVRICTVPTYCISVFANYLLPIPLVQVGEAILIGGIHFWCKAYYPSPRGHYQTLSYEACLY